MAAVTPTTTRDILGLALLAALSERPSDRTEAVDAVRALCLPWLTPTRDVVEGIVTEYRKAGYVHEGEDPRIRDGGPPGSSRIEVTPAGERELRRLVRHRTGQPPHHLAVLCESLRLAVVDRLDSRTRAALIRGLLRARRRCLAMQRRRLLGAGGANPALTRTLRHLIACAEAELDVVAGAYRMDERDAVTFVPSST